MIYSDYSIVDSIPPSDCHTDSAQGPVGWSRSGVGDDDRFRDVSASDGGPVHGNASSGTGIQLRGLSLRLDQVPALHCLGEGKVSHHEQARLRGELRCTSELQLIAFHKLSKSWSILEIYLSYVIYCQYLLKNLADRQRTIGEIMSI